MLRIDESQRKLVPLAEGTLASENLLERGDVQELITSSWDESAEELGFPTMRLLGSEIQPHESVANRIDILAFDEEVGVPVIIELKRHKHKLHLLQALSYSAMVWTWDADSLRRIAGPSTDDDLLNSIDNLDEKGTPRTILIAEEYDPEVVLTADWLRRRHDVDIYCFSLSLQRHGDERLVRLQLDYPLRELDEVYRSRHRAAGANGPASLGDQTWESVKEWVEHDWMVPLIDIFRGLKDGDPKRRRFSSMFGNEWGSYNIAFRKAGLRVYIRDRREGDLEHWGQVLPDGEVKSWGSDITRREGITFKMTTWDAVKRFLIDVGREDIARTVDQRQTTNISTE